MMIFIAVLLQARLNAALACALVCESDKANSKQSLATAQMDVDESSALDETFHLHNVKASCDSVNAAKSPESKSILLRRF